MRYLDKSVAKSMGKRSAAARLDRDPSAMARLAGKHGAAALLRKHPPMTDRTHPIWKARAARYAKNWRQWRAAERELTVQRTVLLAARKIIDARRRRDEECPGIAEAIMLALRESQVIGQVQWRVSPREPDDTQATATPTPTRHKTLAL